MKDASSLSDRDLLRRVWLFAGLRDEELEMVARLGRRRHVVSREVVVHQGEPSGELFAVLEGCLRVSSTSAEGEDLVLSIVDVGEVFGEIALLDGGVRSATVMALRPCHLLVIHRDAFNGLLARVPSIGLKLLEVLARRLRAVSERAEDATFLDVRARLAKILLMLCDRFGEQTSDGAVRIDLKLSQRDLGELIGATREMVNKCLADWTEQGLVMRAAGELIVRELHELKSIARLETSP